MASMWPFRRLLRANAEAPPPSANPAASLAFRALLREPRLLHRLPRPQARRLAEQADPVAAAHTRRAPAVAAWALRRARAPGVGAKLAVRLLSELAAKVGAMPTGTMMPSLSAPAGVEADALSALANLGYRRMEAHPIVLRVRERLGETAGLDAVIRDSLKELARSA